MVSVTETMESIKKIPGISQTQDWAVWGDGDVNNPQVGGWSMKYNFLDFKIVRGAGHVPTIINQYFFRWSLKIKAKEHSKCLVIS